jgi:mycothiol synthase
MTVDTSTVRPAGAGITVRGFRLGDEVPILAAMLAALGRGEYEGMERYQLEHAAERLAFDLAPCQVAEVDGELAGWVIPADDDLMVVPAFRRRGVGRALVHAGRDLVAQSGGDRLRLWVRRDDATEAFAASCGLQYASSLWQMRLSSGPLADVAEPAFPADTRVRTLRVGVDEAPFVALVNRIFVDHPSPIALNEPEVRRIHATPGFDPASVLVVEDAQTSAMVAFCRVHAFTTGDGTSSGEIRLLGVDRAWRNRGLGRAVTEWGVAELRRRGAQSVVLAVEGRNQSALQLYEHLGFRRGTEWRHWTIAAWRGS